MRCWCCVLSQGSLFCFESPACTLFCTFTSCSCFLAFINSSWFSPVCCCHLYRWQFSILTESFGLCSLIVSVQLYMFCSGCFTESNVEVRSCLSQKWVGLGLEQKYWKLQKTNYDAKMSQMNFCFYLAPFWLLYPWPFSTKVGMQVRTVKHIF